MGRLIDADDAINVFANRLFETLKTNLPCVTAEENQICLETCYKVAKYEIDTIPTAYSIEKVVAESEQQAEQYRNRGFEHEQKGFSAMADKYYGKQCSYLNAIDIVKRGGVE